MRVVRRALKLAGGALLGVLLVLALAFGLLQTGPGKNWLADALSKAMSSAGERMTITGIAGLVPFDMRIARIEIADDRGPRVVVEGATLTLAPADLLKGTFAVRRLAAERIRLDHPSSASGSTNLDTLLHPPLAIRLDELRIDRLELGAAMVGEPMSLALTASGALLRDRAGVDLEIRRINGPPGEVRLHAVLDGTPLRLALTVAASEPSGRVLA